MRFFKRKITKYKSKKILKKLNNYNNNEINNVKILYNKLNNYNKKMNDNIYYNYLISDINEFINNSTKNNENLSNLLGNYLIDLVNLINMQKYTNTNCMFVINLIYKHA